ncbi:MAG: EF-Tu/IF-2/RF-3 family GTPase [Methanotrichaceae archaeon]
MSPLFFAASLARKALMIVDEINPAFGECVIMPQCLGVKEGYIVLRNYLTPEQLSPLIRDTILENYEFVEDDTIAIRERLLEDVNSLDSESPSVANGTVPVDHFFNVKGIGTVVLGSVAEGTIRKHDSLKVLPGEKKAQIRSIQKHDDDFDQACEGDRVGLALKNTDVRGFGQRLCLHQ